MCECLTGSVQSTSRPEPAQAPTVMAAAAVLAAGGVRAGASASAGQPLGLSRRQILAGASGLAASLMLPRRAAANSSRFGPTAAPGCDDLTPALVGGPVPTDATRLTIRWLGCTNYELAYRDQVVLFDTYYERGPRNRPLGFTVNQVHRADAIFIGHGHFDHMSDAVQVSAQTGAPVIGAPVTMEKALASGLPASKAVTVTGRGGELLRFNGFTVEPILAHHSILSGAVLAAFGQAIGTVIGPPTAEQAAAEAVIRAKGTSSPLVITEGTIAYLFTFDTGFKLIYRNSAGPITAYERDALARVGRTDVAIVAYIGQYVAGNQIAITLPLVDLYNPDIYLPCHHDEIAGIFLDMGTEPLFMAIRDSRPNTTSIAPLYRTPICLNVAAKAR
jgi:L-ascorbate metabolism protein UlaG (beta-lactamase superfamily)